MFLALTPAMPAASFIGGAGPTPDPANWFRTSLYSSDVATTLNAAKASIYKDDYVIVIDDTAGTSPNTSKELFDDTSAEATAKFLQVEGGMLQAQLTPLVIKGPTGGNRTVQFDLGNSQVGTIEVLPSFSTEILHQVHIEGVGATQQVVATVETRGALALEHLYLVKLQVTGDVYADGGAGNGAAGDSGSSGGDIIYGAAGTNGTNGNYSEPATNGTDGESVSTDSSGSTGNSGENGSLHAVRNIYLNGCSVATLHSQNSNGGNGGEGGAGQSCHGGAGGAGGDSIYYSDYPSPGNGGNGGNGTCSSNGGAGGQGGAANQTVCTTHGQGSPSTVTYYYKTASGGSGGIGGSKGVGTGGAGGAAGNGYDDESPPGIISTGNPGTAGTGSSTGTNGANGTAGSNYVRALSDPNNKITFTNQY
jgi:hypothetical protein